MDYTRIVITGPESTGKTTLARQLAEATGWPWVPEYARTWLSERGGIYHRTDLLTMARGQEEALAAANAQHLLVIGDTDQLTFLVWDQQKYGSVQPALLEGFPTPEPTFYLVCSPDIAWEPDPLRETPHIRPALLAQHLALLTANGQAHALIWGPERLALALQALAWARSGNAPRPEQP
jgi:nicotinamide riboside kinase